MTCAYRVPVALLAVLISPLAASAGDAAAGAKKAVTCMACHGKDGISIAGTYPNLAGQKEQYIIKALKAYKSGARTDPMMKPMAAPLSDTDIENLAAYYSGMSCK